MDIIVFIHSYLRWVVLALALVVIVKSLLGWTQGKSYESLDNGLASGFLGSLHLQLVLGLILYFAGDKGLALIQANGMGEVMKDSTLRFWAVEHIFTMIIAVVVATIGRARSKRAETGPRRHKTVFIFFLIATVLVLARVPWPPMAELFKGL